jgi:hypothetical protein
MQQRIATLTEALEQSMKIEAMEGYPGSLRITRPLVDSHMSNLQGKISALMEKIQELTLLKPVRPQVWCTGCYTEGHLETECPWIRGMGHPPTGPMGGVVQVSKTPPFHAPVQYNAFPSAQPTQTSRIL